MFKWSLNLTTRFQSVTQILLEKVLVTSGVLLSLLRVAEKIDL